MNDKLKNKPTNQKIIVLFLISFIAIVSITYIDFSLFSNKVANDMIASSIPRLLGGIVFLALMGLIGYRELFRFNSSIKTLLFLALPGILIAINNFPIIAYLDNRAELTEPIYTIYIFMIECFSTAFFEEIIFRGILLILLLQKLPKNKKGMYMAIIISSLIFGVSHLINLFDGAVLSDTLLQVAYSFLMGLLWATVYVKSKNIWIVILLHASYNFFGQVMFKLGYVNNRFDTITIIVTVFLATIAAIYMILISIKTSQESLEDFYSVN